MRKHRLVAAVILILSLTAGYAFRAYSPAEKIDEADRLRQLAPGQGFSEKKERGIPHYRETGGAVAFNTYDIKPSVRGYAGPIKVLLLVDPQGNITGIDILEHSETKNYVRYMETPDYLKQFIGKSVNDPFEIDRDLDGISRATVSVTALARTVKESSRVVASEVLGLKVMDSGPAGRPGSGWAIYLVLLSVSTAGYFLTRKSGRFRRLRDLSLLAGIGIVGLYLSSLFSVIHLFNLMLLRPSSSWVWYAVIVTTLISTLIAGRFYCGWLCPFGALSEFIGRLPFRKWEIPKDTDDSWRNLKYVLLGVAAVLVLVSGRVEFGNYETYVTLFSFDGSSLAWALVLISLIANVRVERFWCRYLCPVAAFTGLVSRNEKGYPGRKDCPIGNVSRPLISECIKCNRCYRPSREGNEDEG